MPTAIQSPGTRTIAHACPITLFGNARPPTTLNPASPPRIARVIIGDGLNSLRWVSHLFATGAALGAADAIDAASVAEAASAVRVACAVAAANAARVVCAEVADGVGAAGASSAAFGSGSCSVSAFSCAVGASAVTASVVSEPLVSAPVVFAGGLVSATSSSSHRPGANGPRLRAASVRRFRRCVTTASPPRAYTRNESGCSHRAGPPDPRSGSGDDDQSPRQVRALTVEKFL